MSLGLFALALYAAVRRSLVCRYYLGLLMATHPTDIVACID